MNTIAGRLRQLWPRGARPPARHQAPDPRPMWRRWEGGPGPSPAPSGGSMLPDYERAGRQAYRGACDDTGEHTATAMMPAVGWARPPLDRPGEAPGYGVVPFFCPRCEAPDDRPHYPGCPFYDPYEAALFAGEPVAAPVPARARALDPAAWRPYLTAAEFAETFPGVPYGQAPGVPHTGDLAAVTPDLADQLAVMDAELADWLHQRGAAHADLRARLLVAWQALQRRL